MNSSDNVSGQRSSSAPKQRYSHSSSSPTHLLIQVLPCVLLKTPKQSEEVRENMYKRSPNKRLSSIECPVLIFPQKMFLNKQKWMFRAQRSHLKIADWPTEYPSSHPSQQWLPKNTLALSRANINHIIIIIFGLSILGTVETWWTLWKSKQ